MSTINHVVRGKQRLKVAYSRSTAGFILVYPTSAHNCVNSPKSTLPSPLESIRWNVADWEQPCFTRNQPRRKGKLGRERENSGEMRGNRKKSKSNSMKCQGKVHSKCDNREVESYLLVEEDRVVQQQPKFSPRNITRGVPIRLRHNQPRINLKKDL